MHERCPLFSGRSFRQCRLVDCSRAFFLLACLLVGNQASAQDYLINGLGEYNEFNETTLIVKLELESPARDALEAIAVDTNKKLSIRILKDKSPRAWSRIWIQNLSINNPPDTIKTQTGDLIAMTQAIKGTLMNGDVVEFERLANDLTILSIDGVEVADFTTPGFFEFLLSAFIGPIPPSSGLKAALLAAGDFNNDTNFLFDSPGYLSDRPRTIARWNQPAPEPAPVARETAAETVAETAEEQPDDAADIVEETAEERPEGTTDIVEETAEEQPESGGADIVEEVTEGQAEEEEAPISITAESLLATQNYQRAVLTKIYQNIKYPSSALRRNHEGSLRISLSIGADGELIDTEIIQNANYRTFDNAAIRAAKRAAPFGPLPAGTLEIPLLLDIPIVFRLE